MPERRSVKINLAPLQELTRRLQAAPIGGAVDTMLRNWGRRYLGFTRRRFVRYSRGGGDWPPLSPATIAQRRGPKRRRKKRKTHGTATTTRGSAGVVAILRDTGTLFNALTIGAPGNLFERVGKGINVGFGGPARHPKGGEAIASIATKHQFGDPAQHLPQREILVEPDQATIDGFVEDAKRAVARLGSEVEHRGGG